MSYGYGKAHREKEHRLCKSASHIDQNCRNPSSKGPQNLFLKLWVGSSEIEDKLNQVTNNVRN